MTLLAAVAHAAFGLLLTPFYHEARVSGVPNSGTLTRGQAHVEPWSVALMIGYLAAALALCLIAVAYWHGRARLAKRALEALAVVGLLAFGWPAILTLAARLWISLPRRPAR